MGRHTQVAKEGSVQEQAALLYVHTYECFPVGGWWVGWDEMRAPCHEQAHQYTCQEERARLKLKDAQAPGYRAEAGGTLHRKTDGVKDQSQK